MASIQRWDVLEWNGARDTDGGADSYRMSKLALEVEIIQFKVDVCVVFCELVRKEISRK